MRCLGFQHIDLGSWHRCKAWTSQDVQVPCNTCTTNSLILRVSLAWTWLIPWPQVSETVMQLTELEIQRQEPRSG
jgi:hypothetical protein